MNDRIEKERSSFQQKVNESGLVERRKQEMQESSDYQRRQRLGKDGRMREGVEVLTKRIYERDHHAEAVPSYTKAQEKAVEAAERVSKKLNE
jgi:hypothetical protein